jgi:hypothetical protein
MGNQFILKVFSGETNKNFLFIDESNTDAVEVLIELFGLSMSVKRLNRITNINEKIKTFLDIRNQLFKQITSYQNNIAMIYDGSINEAYVMGDLCQYLIKKSGLSEFLDHGTSLAPLSHDIIFIGSVKLPVDTVLFFEKK